MSSNVDVAAQPALYSKEENLPQVSKEDTSTAVLYQGHFIGEDGKRMRLVVKKKPKDGPQNNQKKYKPIGNGDDELSEALERFKAYKAQGAGTKPDVARKAKSNDSLVWYYEDEKLVQEVCLQTQQVAVDDVDYSKVTDTARMQQLEYDDVVVELALHNYESFYGLESGSATFDQVNDTSAGIQGWAACILDDTHPRPEANHDESKPASSTPNKIKHRGDREEDDLLKLAVMESMLESTGVHPPTCYQSKIDIYEEEESDEEDADSYCYDDEEEESDQEDADSYSVHCISDANLGRLTV